MTRLRMAVVGVGHLGKEHARILAGLPEVELVGVADISAEQAHSVAHRLGTQAYTDFFPLLPLVDAASIVVSTSYHESVGSEFLRRGIPVLIEKPLAPSASAAANLVTLAQKNQTILQVGHIERFNPAFEEVERRGLAPKYIRAERLGPFSGRSFDTGVVLDLMIHDLDLILTLVNSAVERVEALGVSVFGKHEDIANARLHFASGCIADVTASRAHPVPYRQMHVWCAEGYAGIDFASRRVTLVQPADELRAKGLDPSRLDPASRARIKDELFLRHLETCTIDRKAQDQLTAELNHFVKCVQGGTSPRVSGAHGQSAVALAEQVIDSLRRHAWQGHAAGPTGPLHLPAATGRLFTATAERDVA